MPPVDGVDEDSLLEGFLAYAAEQELNLYAAQEEAVLELFAGNSVILKTPTGSGKSLVAMALCFKAVAEGKRAFYTAPIKALVSEKFFDLCKLLGADQVGMMTGDASVNRDAPIICCTAEILANLALRDGDTADVDYVVMDEFHYYSDRDRGGAWQIPLLVLSRCRFLLMSATLGDTKFFEETTAALTGAPCVLVHSDDRPVPLDYEYRMTPLHETIHDLLEAPKVPIYIVHFTQRSAAEKAQDLMSIDFTSKDKKRAIKDELKGFRFDTPFGKELKRWVHHGVGVHHAGMLPKYRLMVEKLAQKSMLKIICGTDTLGVGVNVPIRTVLFTKLCKYDGVKTRVLSVRDFQQIAGRAGRKGFDDQGSVVAQAPEHSIENNAARSKVVGDAKKARRLKLKKPPERGYAHFDEATFDKLRGGEPERLVPRFDVSHGMLLHVLSRPDEDGCRAMIELIRASHGGPTERRRQGRKAIALFRSLVKANVVEYLPKEDGGGVDVAADLQNDFSLNQTLSLYAVEAISALDPDDPSYALNLTSVIEAILEDPNVVLLRQLDALKGRAIAEMKAQGMEYDERMAELEKIEGPKPLAEFLWATYDVFAESQPWAAGDQLRPKSIARDLYEKGASFREYVKELGLARAEGVLLRYLSNAYKALIQNVPEDNKSDEFYDLCDSLGATIREVDSSLIDEWEKLRNPDEETALAVLEEPEEVDVTRDRRAFTAMVRNSLWRVVMAVARKRYATALEQLDADDDAWTEEKLEESFAPYWETYEHLRTDPIARSPRNTMIEHGDKEWRVTQVLIDPEENQDWALEAVVDLGKSKEAGKPVVTLKRVAS